MPAPDNSNDNPNANKKPIRQAFAENLADVVARVETGVVSVRVSVPFHQLPREQQARMPDELYGKPVETGGTGFIVDPRGYILTNRHVASVGSKVAVTLRDDTTYEARVVASDDKLDLTVLKIDAPAALPVVQWGNSESMRAGDAVFAIGMPHGLDFTVTRGIVSGLHRGINGRFDDYLQTDAAINPGNSGGPLFNKKGEVVGVNTMIFSPSGGSIGLGFAIPAVAAKKVANDIITHGTVKRGSLGISMRAVVEQGKSPHAPSSIGKGAYVDSVVPGSAAERAGLCAGDVIVGFAGKPLKTMRELSVALSLSSPGDVYKMRVLRGTQTLDLTATLDAEKKSSSAPSPYSSRPQPPRRRDMSLDEFLRGLLRDQYGSGGRYGRFNY